jgi:putative hemolysin
MKIAAVSHALLNLARMAFWKGFPARRNGTHKKAIMLYVELGIVTILIVINGLLSMSELAIVSSRPARLAALAERNVKGSRRALALASDPGKFLSTVQIGITLIGVLSGAFSGATLGLRLTSLLTAAGWSQGVADAIGVGAVVTVITYASLIIGELVPKQIALRDPESVAVRVAPYMMLLATISLPAVWLLDRSGKALLWLLGQRGEASEKVSEDEIRTLVVEAENAGVLEPGEKEMIAGVMRLGDLPVGAVMTPRREVSMVNLTDDLQAIRSALAASSHSRFVVFDPAADAAVGIVNAKDMLDCYLLGETLDVGKLVRPAPIIPEFLDARDVVAILRDSAVHMGLVHDEYGAFQGVVTSADILESIVGGFHTEEGPPEAAAIRRDDGSYLISGWMSAVEFASLLRFELPASRHYQTVAGFLLSHFGRIPDVGDQIEAEGWRFEVLDLDGRRIDKVLAVKISDASA